MANGIYLKLYTEQFPGCGNGQWYLPKVIYRTVSGCGNGQWYIPKVIYRTVSGCCNGQ